MVAVKTKDGQVIPGPTQIARLPKAGRTVKVYQASADTTLSSTQSTTNENKLAGQAWLSIGNDSGTYGVTHSVLKFPAMTDIPTTAKVVDGRVALWSAGMTGNAQATYDVHGLTKDFSETGATWKNATSTTAWISPGYSKDYGDLGEGLTKDAGGPTIEEEIPKMRNRSDISQEVLGSDERPTESLKGVSGGRPGFRFRRGPGAGDGEGGSDTVPWELLPWVYVCEKNPADCPLVPDKMRPPIGTPTA